LEQKILSIAQSFLQLPTAPFREHFIVEFIEQFCLERKISLKKDTFGNLIATSGSSTKSSSATKLAFIAHMDHPGFIIEKNSSANKCTALFYGGWDPTEFKAAPIRFYCDKDLSVGAVALRWEKAEKEMAWRAYLTVNGPVLKGDLGMWDFSPYKIKRDLLYSRCCDDSIGCILLLSLLDYFSSEKLNIPFNAIFTRAEEPGLHGAKHICTESLLQKKTIPISVETSRELQVAKIGDGVIIRVGDARTIFTPEITEKIVFIAKGLKASNSTFAFQRKLMDGGQCEGTVFSSFGYKTGALSISLGNYHNRNFSKKTTEPEYVSIQDVTNAFLLMKTMIEQTKTFAFDKRTSPVYRKIEGPLGQTFYI
jgi:putative aminopeptidase FrvX